jgi:hypothetical protein
MHPFQYPAIEKRKVAAKDGVCLKVGGIYTIVLCRYMPGSGHDKDFLALPATALKTLLHCGLQH